MADWLRAWTKIYHYHYVVVAVAGLVATVFLASPGSHTLALGPLRVDAFYIALASFGFLLVLSVTDEYAPEDYGLESDDTGK